jgi:RNA polymerase sigma-70 factor (ECF subfamily)
MERSVNRNDDAGFEQRIVALYPQLFRLALRLCRNHADAHDLAQDAVERGLRCRDLFRSGDRPDRWMFTILRRIFVDECRGRRRRPRVPLLDEHEAVLASETEAPCAWEDFGLDDVQRALLFVDRVGREIFSLFVFGNVAQKEIARRLSIPQKTVATRMFRTRAKLKAILESGAYRRRLALVRPPVALPPIPPPPAAAAAQTAPHAPRSRVAAERRRNRVTAAGIA